MTMRVFRVAVTAMALSYVTDTFHPSVLPGPSTKERSIAGPIRPVAFDVALMAGDSTITLISDSGSVAILFLDQRCPACRSLDEATLAPLRQKPFKRRVAVYLQRPRLADMVALPADFEVAYLADPQDVSRLNIQAVPTAVLIGDESRAHTLVGIDALRAYPR